MVQRLARRIVLLVVTVGVVGGGLSPSAAQEAKIGFVDLQKVLLESKRGQDVLAKLQAQRAEKQRELDDREKKIRQMEADLEKQRSVLSEGAKKERERAIVRERRELSRTVEDLNREFGERERDVRDRLIREVSDVVRDYGDKHGYLMIMERRAGGIMYGREAADLSKEVITAYDAGADGKKK